MKKQIFILALLGILFINFNLLKAQDRPDKKPSGEQVDKLTTTQIELVNKILSDFNSKSISADDAKAIMEALRGSEIPPGKGVADAINAAGFNFDEIRKLAPPPSRPEGNPDNGPGNNSDSKPGSNPGNTR